MEEFKMDEPYYVESPCISVCEIETDTGYCKGCWRTRDEVAGWNNTDSVQRLEIIERLHQRREKAGVGRRRRNQHRKSPAVRRRNET